MRSGYTTLHQGAPEMNLRGGEEILFVYVFGGVIALRDS
jgi:hypothetical protein